MTIYSLILFLHVVGAFGILVSFGLEWFGLDSLQRSCTAELARASLKGFSVSAWIGGPSLLIVLLSGIYMWETAWRGTAWTVIGLISLVVVGVIGAILTGRRVEVLGKALSEGAGSEPDVHQLVSMPVLWASLQVRTLMVLGIAFLMTIKPGVAGSVITMIIAALFGLAMNPAIVNYYRSHKVCAVSRRV